MTKKTRMTLGIIFLVTMVAVLTIATTMMMATAQTNPEFRQGKIILGPDPHPQQ